MNNAIAQSVAIQRQIPEYIKESYPLFVEFVKLYYDFLSDSQTQDLESFRDIDTTLEEFIERFKSELANNIPIELASDKRMLLRHLREFYLSRGSENSYKFLFKTLFGKEATLFYPSTQLLRVSDGKWNQEVSIFVDMTSNTNNLFALANQFITISTEQKQLQTYVEKVIQYSTNIYEVFIQRDYINEILADASVSCVVNSITYSGTILKCPSKISIYKRGVGFKPGDIFTLNTDRGDGCVIKVTKVNSVGGILAIQVIKFGLDYETKFWSYLSATQLNQIEFIHPLTLNWSLNIVNVSRIGDLVTITTSAPHYFNKGNVVAVTATTNTSINGSCIVLATPTATTFTYKKTGVAIAPNTVDTGTISPASYQEGTTGFVEYGYATKQTYMYYDANIPVGSEDKASDRFYSDGSYVGDIERQFYANQSKQDLTADYAVLEVDLGAVARYPGYYSTADGFISDEMYIQDGNYYQSFSYVIKVEEELRKYVDLVKAVLHPAGMKLFAEYQIDTYIELAFVTPFTNKVIQFADSTNRTEDSGYSYTQYVSSIDEFGTVTISPAPEASLFLKSAGKLAWRMDKRFSSSTSNEDLIYSKYTEKFIENSVSVSGTDVNSKYIETLKEEDISIEDVLVKDYSKPLNDTIVSPTDDETNEVFKNISETQTLTSDGRVRKNQYDLDPDYYFARFEDYQAATNIT